ncbi:MAG: hypothetical protein KGZ58_01250 [Ignavibacteriales bacterium]|nr:hypothetical protein [Ignavibacteriales bacterium]
MKFFVTLFILLSCFSLHCKNPFAPGLNTELSQGVCPPLTEVEGVFCTFRNAYSFKDTTMYSSLLADNFTFLFRDYDNGVDVTWGRDDEMRSTYGLFANAQQLTLIWNTFVSQNITTVDATILRAFTLSITFNPSDIIRIDGYANIKMQRDDKTKPWKIVQWRDESNF